MDAETKMVLTILPGIIIIALIIVLLVIVVKMANQRGRSGFGWFMLSILITPFSSMLLLYLLGETNVKRKKRIIDEEELRNQYRNQKS